ncbi:MAG TPA: NAD(P)H-dependent oxidoreductase [Clostridia bacterium]|nr:NAD(P)H-dependent oxidoreductase [Clostridia bacterium]
MNVLVINGSPKGENSNTMRLVHAFLNGSGYAEAKIVHVADTKIRPCLGCFACWNKTPGVCAIHDGMEELLSQLIAADIIIWAFPLYYFGIPGGLKNIIDRQLPLVCPFMASGNDSGGHPARYDLSHQRHVVISTCGFWTIQGNYDAVIAMYDHYYGAGNYARIFCGQGELFHIAELSNRTDDYLETVKRAGAEFTAGGICAQTQADLDQPLFPRDVFEKMADASWEIQSGEETSSDDSLSFTTQMAALYVPDGKDRILEFNYTDINKTYQMLLTPQGSEVITERLKNYTTRIETPYSVWRAIARGEISGQEALFQRQYKVQGDFDIMLHWDELFGVSASKKPAVEKQKRKTNMIVLLAPWMAIWMAASISANAGGIAGILAVAALPLFWIVFQPVIFEQISVPIVAGLSLMILLGVEMRMVVPASYGAFGLMWFIGAFTKTPLTAYYSAGQYGGDKAFANPLFVWTNRILTAAWGVLYLVTPIWTYFLMGTKLAAYIGLFNSICPAIMGVFTAWFQKWYPARWSRN